MTLTRNKRKSMKKHMRMLAIILVPVVALILGAAVPELWAGHDDDDDDELEFEEVEFNIEFNSTDEDLGVRGFVDGEPWKELEIENPKGRTIAEIEAKKSMAKQGFAELFFESGEPTLEDVSVKKFLKRFPKGTYEFEGETIEGDEIEGEAEFTHVIPCGPDESLKADFVDNPGSVTIKWSVPDQVVDLDDTESGDIQCEGPPPTIDGYEVILESDNRELTFKLDAVVVTELVIPLSLLEPGTEYEFEVIAIEESGNQTITEADFETP